MYLFEMLGEVHLPVETIRANSAEFMKIFHQSLSDQEIKVRVAALKATAAFLCSIDNTMIVFQFQSILEEMINTTVLAINADEEKGRETLETFAQLAEYHPELFRPFAGKLVEVVAEVMSHCGLENKTRTSATEVVVTLCEKSGTIMRTIEQI